MLGITDYGAFCLAVLVFLALPGPGNFALLNSTGKGGLRAGAAATLGIILGDQALMWLALGGVAALLAAYPWAFGAVQFAGAAYLGWVGLKLVIARAGDPSPIDIEPRHYLKQALFITLLNPKAIVFYMAFLPLFIDPKTHQTLPTFAAMALTVAAMTAAYCLTLCAFADRVANKVKAHQRLAGWLSRFAGIFLIGFGLRLLRN